MLSHRRIVRARARAVAVAVGVLVLLAPTVARADAPPERIIDVVQVTWAGAPATPAATGQQVADVIKSDVIARWSQISGGRVAFSFGRLLPTLRTAYALPCDAAGSLSFINGVAQTAYASAGISDISHHYLVEVAADPGGCVWDGRGLVGAPGSTSGALILKDTADPDVIAHELGHNMGLGHSNLETCSGGKADGAWSDCTAVEYGSATDLMGNTTRTSALSAYHQWRLGWIPDGDVAVGNRTTTVSLHAVDSQPATTCVYSADTTTVCPWFTRALFVRDGSAAYWVEFRHADPANSIKQGLVIYRTDPPPASSVQSPIASDAADPTSTHITTDVWMVNLGNWSYPAATGSPSLAEGGSFTTAFGGATISARVASDGTATVSVVRAGSSAPAAPTFTDTSSWRNPDAPLNTADLDDKGVDIAYFEAEKTVGSAVSIVRVPRVSPAFYWERTYLDPVAPPALARLGDLPEGQYSLRLRAVNVSGVAGAWSASVPVKIDRGSPVVTGDFGIAALVPGRSVAAVWRGATDAGSGICSARVLNPDGWASLGWSGAVAGVPRYVLPSTASEGGDGQVFDCVGNGVAGTVSVDTGFRPASAIKRSGVWRAVRVSGAAVTVAPALVAAGAASGGSAGASLTAAPSVPGLLCVGACSATVSTAAGTAAVLVGGSAVALTVDGRRAKPLPASKRKGARVAYVANGAHKVVLRGRGLVLVGVQSVRGAWTQGSLLSGTPHPVDGSLADRTQALLAGIGFAQSDFADSVTVQPMPGGTTLADATLDFCSSDFPSDALRVARRQVTATRPADPYSFLSTETVRYSSAAATAQALKELDAASASCQSRGYALLAGGAKQAYAFRALPQLPSGLRPAADRRLFYVQMGESTTATTFLLAYQFSGDTLNAMYVAKPGAWTLSPDEVSRWLEVAAVLAGRLDRGVAKLDAMSAI